MDPANDPEKNKFESFFEKKNIIYATILLIGWATWILTLSCVISPSVTIPSGERSCVEEAGSVSELLKFAITYPLGIYFSFIIGWLDEFPRTILSFFASFLGSLVCVNIIRGILGIFWKFFVRFTPNMPNTSVLKLHEKKENQELAMNYKSPSGKLKIRGFQINSKELKVLGFVFAIAFSCIFWIISGISEKWDTEGYLNGRVITYTYTKSVFIFYIFSGALLTYFLWNKFRSFSFGMILFFALMLPFLWFLFVNLFG